jgi:hypothetical protein
MTDFRIRFLKCYPCRKQLRFDKLGIRKMKLIISGILHILNQIRDVKFREKKNGIFFFS